MSLWTTLAAIFAAPPTLDGAVRQALEKTVELIDPRLVNAPGLERALAGPLQYALGYCDGLVDALPGPIGIERRAFATDPLVHALFATGNDVNEMLGKSQAVRDFLDETASYAASHFYAMFAARRIEKKQLGSVLHGETIQHDVPQTVLYFADHTLTEPAATLEATRQRLRAATFMSLLKTFRAHLEDLRAEREGVRSHLSAERSQLSQLRLHGRAEEAVFETRRVEVLDQRLRELGDVLDPAGIVRELAAFIAAPEASLALQAYAVTVDRMGVVLPDEVANGDGWSRLEFPELISRDRRRYLVTLARVDCDEARRAVREAADARRRYVLI